MFAGSHGHRRRFALIAAAAAVAALALLAIVARASAAERIYWDNHGASPSSIAFANIDGSGGGTLNLGGVELYGPEGMAYDPANGRIYAAGYDNNEIVWAAIDGSGGGVLDTGVAPVEDPAGIAIDPRTQIVYWANYKEKGSIGYASAAGGDGGTLNTGGFEAEDPAKIALDTANWRLYWINDVGEEEGEVFYANLDGTGGGALNLSEAERFEDSSAINVDPAMGRLYVLFPEAPKAETISWINLSGVGGGVVDTESAAVEEPYGLAFDPSLGRFYWGNYESAGSESAFGTATLALGGGGRIAVATAPVNGPQDPVVLKSPTGTGAPLVTASGTALSCSQGSWAPDYPGSYVYGAPDSYAYQWSKGGQAIAGATGSSYAATVPGSYSCTVTATNRLGSASQTSAGTRVPIVRHGPIVAPAPAPASLTLKLAKKKAAKVRAGKVAVVKVDVANGGGTASGAVKVCAKLNKKVKKGLKAPKCVAVGPIPAGKAVIVRLRVKTKKSAKGVYKFAVEVKGATVNSVTAKVQVVQAKHRHKKHKQRTR